VATAQATTTARLHATARWPPRRRCARCCSVVEGRSIADAVTWKSG